MKCPDYLAITGGIGGAKLCLGLAQILGSNELAFLVNTGDDFIHLGLHISPDIDTLVYTLSGEVNTDTGWGRRDETWNFMAALRAMGGEDWFQLGDRDLAMHIERTRRLAEGQSLSLVTATLAQSLGVAHPVMPMSNDPVRTMVRTQKGLLEFQHYFVRERCAPAVSGFEFEGAAEARLDVEVANWLGSPQLKGVILCPSNPFVSIGPVLSIAELLNGLKTCSAPVIAVSPVVGGKAIKGPTVKMMRELGIPNTSVQVARHYAGFLDGFVLDSRDAGSQASVEELGLPVLVTNTVMTNLDERIQLGRDCLAFVTQVGQP